MAASLLEPSASLPHIEKTGNTPTLVYEETCDIKDEKISWNMYLYGFIATLGLVSVGSCLVWPSPVIPHLLSNNTEINPLGTPITTLQVSLLVTIPFVFCIISMIIIARLSDKLGRKKMMLIGCSGISGSMFIISLASNIYVYYICFIIIGLMYSFIYLNVPLYNNEIADPENRGKMGCIAGLGMPLGMLLVYLFGPITSVSNLSLICGASAGLHVLLNIVLEHTPTYLILHRKKIEALSALQKIRSNKTTVQIEKEYMELEDSIRSCSNIKNPPSIHLFKKKSIRKAVYISLILAITQEISGISIILSFMTSIFNAAGSTLSSHVVGILVGLLQIIFFLVATYLVDKVGRRILLLCSSLSCAVCMLCMGIYFYLIHIKYEISEIFRWIPVITVVVFIIGYSCGLGPIPIFMVGELFPTKYRSLGTATVVVLSLSLNILVMFSFPLLTELYGIYFTISLHSLLEFVGFICVLLYVPETKGKQFLMPDCS